MYAIRGMSRSSSAIQTRRQAIWRRLRSAIILPDDTLFGGAENDTYVFNQGDGQDLLVDSDATTGNTDTIHFGANISPLDLVISRNADDLRLALHGSNDQVTIQNWYSSPNNQAEVI